MSFTERTSFTYHPGLPEPGKNNLWYFYDDSDTVLVFVHGIFSDSRGCWLYQDPRDAAKQMYWPDLILRDPRIVDTSIYLGGYYTTIDSGPYEIRNCADELLSGLSMQDEHRRDPVMTKKNIVFVCHSTGGIVVRYLLESNYQHFAEKNIGLILLASPSYGSRLADKLSLLAGFYNQRLGQQLQWGNWSLRDLDARFKNLLNDRKIGSFSGVEAYENHFILHRKWLPSKRVVVTEESAGRYFGAPILLRGTDHFATAKPNELGHPSHQLLAQFLQSHFAPKALDSSPSTDEYEEAPSASRTITVDKSGSGDYRRVGPAVRSASPGDRIVIREGLYLENLQIDKQLKIIGEGDRHKVRLEGDTYPSVVVDAERVEIANLSVRRAESGSGPALLVAGGEVAIRNCSISSKSDFGIEVTNEASLSFAESEVQFAAKTGISARDGSVAVLEKAAISDCQFHGLHAVSGSNISISESELSSNGQCGILLEDAGKGFVSDSQFSRNRLSGVQVTDGEECRLHGNTIVGNQQGIRISGAAQCICLHNKISKSEFAGIHVVGQSCAEITANVLFDNTTNGVFVDSSGQITILDNKVHDNRMAGIDVANGSQPNVSGNSIFENAEAGIRVYDGAEPLIVSNEIRQNRLAGVIIHSGGNPEVRKNRIFENDDAGVNCYEAALGRIQNNEIHSNQLSGIIVSRRSNPLISANRIYKNRQCGVLCLDGGLGILTENHIHQNCMSGVLSRNSSTPTCKDNLVEGNQEAGIAAINEGGGVFERNRVKGNRVGIGLEHAGVVTLRANTITDNREVGIELEATPAEIVENELHGNVEGPMKDIGIRHSQLVIRRNAGL